MLSASSFTLEQAPVAGDQNAEMACPCVLHAARCMGFGDGPELDWRFEDNDLGFGDGREPEPGGQHRSVGPGPWRW